MTTATLPFKVQRSRFFHHLVEAVASAVPGALRNLLFKPAQPLTADETAALEAQKVRQLARRHAKTDPGFAADLYAAAARHEGGQSR